MSTITFTRQFILSAKHHDTVVFDHQIKGVVYKLPNIKLVIDENAWSANKHKDTEEIKSIQKKVIGLFNKLTAKNYESISEKFIDIMQEHPDDFTDLVPTLYETILKLLCYNNSYIQLFLLYGNKAFTDLVIACSLLEWEYTIGKKEDTRKYKSLLEEPETIKKRYQSNNLLFLCDLYVFNLLNIDSILQETMDADNIDKTCIMFYNIHKQLKTKNKQLRSDALAKIKTWSKDTAFSAKIRFQCMDVLDKVY
jgi:hypothetical protein